MSGRAVKNDVFAGGWFASGPRVQGDRGYRPRPQFEGKERAGRGGRAIQRGWSRNAFARSELACRAVEGRVDRRLAGSAGPSPPGRAGCRGCPGCPERNGAQQRHDEGLRGAARRLARKSRRGARRRCTAGAAGGARQGSDPPRRAPRGVGRRLCDEVLRGSRAAPGPRCPAPDQRGLSRGQAHDRGPGQAPACTGALARAGRSAVRAGADGARRSRLCSSRPRQDPAAQDRAGAMRGGTRGRPGGTRTALSSGNQGLSQPHGCGESRPLLKGSFIDKEKESREKNGHHR